jgi:hypothetical protein
MTRREVLKAFRDFCILNGIGGILVPQAFGQVVPAKKRFVSFVIKYTGGGTYFDGLGHWTFDSMLAPLAPYKNEMCFPMGLNCEYTVPMNSHAAPQISALTGAMTGSEKLSDGAYYPTGNLLNYSNGNGKSIDVLIGEKLQSIYKCQLPTLQISNYGGDAQLQESTYIRSSYGAGGVLLPTYYVVNDLSAELKNRINCNVTTDAALKATLDRKLAVLDVVKRNNLVFDSKYIIDKAQFANLEAKTQKARDVITSALTNSTGTVPSICGNFPTLPQLESEWIRESSINTKMNVMFDLAIAAFQANVTRSINVNLMTSACHLNSHFIEFPPVDKYLAASKFLQQQIANFVAKLKAAGMYDETLIFCNAGSAMSNEVHNYENLSTYVINGDKTGVVGSPTVRKPVSSLLLDILYKFDIQYAEYGGYNNKYGVGKRTGFI